MEAINDVGTGPPAVLEGTTLPGIYTDYSLSQ